jgi:hypothetical protein
MHIVGRVQMPVMQEIDMIAMHYLLVAAIPAVNMGMSLVDLMIHNQTSFSKSRYLIIRLLPRRKQRAFR